MGSMSIAHYLIMVKGESFYKYRCIEGIYPHPHLAWLSKNLTNPYNKLQNRPDYIGNIQNHKMKVSMFERRHMLECECERRVAR